MEGKAGRIDPLSESSVSNLLSLNEESEGGSTYQVPAIKPIPPLWILVLNEIISMESQSGQQVEE
jgi:hypothetical protein